MQKAAKAQRAIILFIGFYQERKPDIAHINLLYNALQEYDMPCYVYTTSKLENLDIPQNHVSAKDTGASMYMAVKNVMEIEHVEHVLMIFDHSSSHILKFITQAFAELKYNSFVIGPNYSGGYNLLAMRQLRVELFEKIVWNGTYILSDTIRKINSLVKTYFLLPPTP